MISVRSFFVKLLDSFFLLRIPLLAPVWTILLLGWVTSSNMDVFHYRLHEPGTLLFHDSTVWGALAAFSFIVASIYVMNQIVDIENDRINHKLFLLPQGIISIPAAWTLALLCAGFGFALCYIWFDRVMISLFAFSFLLGILYNLPPFSLKNGAWGGTLANFLGHGVLTFLVGWYAANINTASIGDLLSTGLCASLSSGFANAAVYITTTIADAPGDRLTGKRTFCVRYGPKASAIAAMIGCLLALVFSFALESNWWVMAFPSVLSLVLFINLAVSVNKRNAFKAFKWPVFLLTASVFLFVPAYGILIGATFFGSRIYYGKRFQMEYPTFKAE